MHDQSVPNPLAKNPNVHTHKVFAAVGLILIGVIVVVSGIWYYVEVQSGARDKDLDDSTATKFSTSSAKQKTKAEEKTDQVSEDWKITGTSYTKLKQYSFEYPAGWKIESMTRAEGLKAGTDIFIFSPDYKASTENVESLGTGAKISIWKSETTKTVIEENENFVGLKKETMESTKVAGVKALTYDYNYEDVTATQTVFINNGTYYSITFEWANIQTKQRYLENYNNLLKTFKFL